MNKLKRDQNFQVYILLILLSCLIVLIFSALMYISRDKSLYSTLFTYFGITNEFQRFLQGIPVSSEFMINMMTMSSAFYCFFCLYFSISLNFNTNSKIALCVKIICLIIAVLQTLLFNTQFVEFAYLRLFDIVSLEKFHAFYDGLSLLFNIYNAALLIIGIALVVWLFLTSPKISIVRLPIFALLAAIVILDVLYLMVFHWLPTQLLWISKIADIVIYKRLPILRPGELTLYMIGVWIAVCAVSFVALMLYLLSITKITRHDFEFSKKVDISTATIQTISHYMKNQLLAIKSEIELADKSDNLNVTETFSTIEKICDDSYERLRSLKNVSNQLSLKPIFISNLIKQLEDNYKNATDIIIEFNYPEEEVVVLGDEFLLLETFTNLINNSIDSIRPLQKMPKHVYKIELYTTKYSHWVRVSIADNGPGIPAKELKCVFEPFYSTKPLSKNWGLGLAICKGVILKHGGKISVASNTNKTVFHVFLPNIN